MDFAKFFGLDLMGPIEKKIVGFSFIMMVVAAFFSLGFFHPDEQYYAVDFAAFKAGLLSSLDSWEYQTRLRPWALPFVFLPFVKFFDLLGLNPFSMATGLRLLSGLFSFGAVCLFLKTVRGSFRKAESFLWLSFLLHLGFFFKVFSVRTNSENWATAFLLVGLSFLLRKEEKGFERPLAAFLLGLAFLMRHQMGFIVLGLGLHQLFVRKVGLKRWFLGFVLPITLCFLLELALDSLGYGRLSFSPFNYIYENLYLDKIKQFGEHSVFFYLIESLKKLGPFSPLMLFGLLYFALKKRSHYLLWSVLPFLVVHHLIGHKELRFLYPVAPLMLTMGIMACEEIDLLEWKGGRPIFKFFASLNLFVMIFLALKPAYTPLKFYKALYDSGISSLHFHKVENRPIPILDLDLYVRENFKVKAYSGELQDFSGDIWTTKYGELKILAAREECEILFSTYPLSLLENFNPTNWRERSNVWALTRCEK